MPQIDVHLIQGVFNAEQKKQIIQTLTDAMVSVEGENMRGVPAWLRAPNPTDCESISP